MVPYLETITSVCLPQCTAALDHGQDQASVTSARRVHSVYALPPINATDPTDRNQPVLGERGRRSIRPWVCFSGTVDRDGRDWTLGRSPAILHGSILSQHSRYTSRSASRSK